MAVGLGHCCGHGGGWPWAVEGMIGWMRDFAEAKANIPGKSEASHSLGTGEFPQFGLFVLYVAGRAHHWCDSCNAQVRSIGAAHCYETAHNFDLQYACTENQSYKDEHAGTVESNESTKKSR